MKVIKLFAVVALLALGGKAYSSCIVCTTAANNGKCYSGSCSKDNLTGDKCCGTYIPE